MRIPKLVAFLSIFISLHIYGQEGEKISSDQPDQSAGSSVLDKRILQIESSLYVNHFKGQGTAVVSSNVVRLGLFEKLEGRLLVEQGHNRDLYISESAHGSSPFAIGTKIELGKETRKVPALSVMAFLQIPITSHPTEPVIWAPSLALIAEKHLADFTLNLNGGLREAAFERAVEWMSTADLKYDVSASISLFGEYFAQFQVHEHPLHNFDAGLLYAITRRLQVHIAAGSSVFYQPANYFINTGLAFNLKM